MTMLGTLNSIYVYKHNNKLCLECEFILPHGSKALYFNELTHDILNYIYEQMKEKNVPRMSYLEGNSALLYIENNEVVAFEFAEA